MFCCTLLYVHSSIAIILTGKRELVDLLNLCPWCFVMVEWLFLMMPWGCLPFVIVVFSDHTLFLFLLLDYKILQEDNMMFKMATSIGLLELRFYTFKLLNFYFKPYFYLKNTLECTFF